MRKLSYANGNILVADRTCKAVLRYARGLAIANKSDVIMVPIIMEGNVEAFAHLLIGPASELMSIPVENSDEGPINLEILADLEKRTLALQPSRPAWNQEMPDVPNLDDLEFDYL